MLCQHPHSLSVLLRFLALILFFSVSGCATWEKSNTKVASITLHLETSPELPSAFSEFVQMPIGEERLYIASEPALDEKDILNVELIQAEAHDKSIYLFAFDLTPLGKTKLHKIIERNGEGRRIVLKINGQPVSFETLRKRNVEQAFWFPTRMSLNDSERAVIALREAVKKLTKQSDKKQTRFPSLATVKSAK